MPIVTVNLIAGYDAQTKAQLGKVMTDAVRSIIPASSEAVTVILDESPAENYMRGGVTHVPAAALPDPSEIVREFLTAMEARDLDAARGFTGEGFAMTFPGGMPMTTLEELVAFARPRYRFVKKTYERFDSLPGCDLSLVYCFGTLSGEWPDGEAFAGIRFIDRFEIVKGKIIRQDVWNDIAETRGRV